MVKLKGWSAGQRARAPNCVCFGCSQSVTTSTELPRVAEIPLPADNVAWTGHLRFQLPQYVVDQIYEAAHAFRCTQVSLVLRCLAAHRNHEGRNVFHIRTEDLVPDRRKIRRPPD